MMCVHRENEEEEEEEELPGSDEPETPSTLEAGTKIPEGFWEIHLNFFALDGVINDFDHVHVRVVCGAFGSKNNNIKNNFRVDFPVNLVPELEYRSTWSGRN